MKWTLFCSDGPEAKRIIEECHAKLETRNELRSALLKKHYGVGLVADENGHGQPNAIIMESERGAHWLKFKETTKRDGKTYYVFTPRRDVKQGKELYIDMLDGRLNFVPSDFIVKECNAQCQVYSIDDFGVYTSVGWIKDGKLYVQIPGNTIPKLPDWMVECEVKEDD